MDFGLKVLGGDLMSIPGVYRLVQVHILSLSLLNAYFVTTSVFNEREIFLSVCRMSLKKKSQNFTFGHKLLKYQFLILHCK